MIRPDLLRINIKSILLSCQILFPGERLPFNELMCHIVALIIRMNLSLLISTVNPRSQKEKTEDGCLTNRGSERIKISHVPFPTVGSFLGLTTPPEKGIKD